MYRLDSNEYSALILASSAAAGRVGAGVVDLDLDEDLDGGVVEVGV